MTNEPIRRIQVRCSTHDCGWTGKRSEDALLVPCPRCGLHSVVELFDRDEVQPSPSIEKKLDAIAAAVTEAAESIDLLKTITVQLAFALCDMARLGAAGKTLDVKMYARRLAGRYKKTLPALAKKLLATVGPGDILRDDISLRIAHIINDETDAPHLCPKADLLIHDCEIDGLHYHQPTAQPGYSGKRAKCPYCKHGRKGLLPQ